MAGTIRHRHGLWKVLVGLAAAALLLPACQGNGSTAASGEIRVLAVETFLADIAQNVAGERVKVEALTPIGLDPHAFEPTPRDVARIAECDVFIVNGAGFEGWLNEITANAGGNFLTVEASAGLTSRQPRASELAVNEHAGEGDAHTQDPHFWLDPTQVIRYVENIRDGLSQADPAGKAEYTANADAYIAKLKELDGWITEQVKQIPDSNRKIVTNHESFGYFADRYGFTIIGTIVPGVSSGTAPSAQQLASLVDEIRAAHAPAVFLETGSSPQLAEQLATETGIKVISNLHTHSVTAPDGEAPTYLDMMRKNTEIIVSALR